MIIAIVGPHGVGKTTLGQALARRLGVAFHDEVGRRLAADPILVPAHRTACDEQIAFDEAVFAAELARDQSASIADRVVETWHPGNLAFAEARSPGFLARRLPGLRQHVRTRQAVVIALVAPAPVLRARQSEPGPASFFLGVGRRAPVLARRLGLPVIATVDTSRRGAEALAEHLASPIAALVAYTRS